ncbi:U32 family peptidase [Desulfopila sp. IMCC35008]|uniref:peptidase U32 family protein n=1 Tax=Desulfopila sp. IMCC35008 TaxID=2653858 RepID=UPI00351762E3
MAAINHGADAVYIGAPRFGARAAAGNSLQDIEKLIRHAHLFRARVYIALNTLFTDSELESAVKLAWQLYDIGSDALIIQDMGLLECDLPPIPLHASTQTNNRTAEKVRFLEDVGFQQVVLARELSLTQVRRIRQKTTLPLECFVHGALCVSYSGQCYISERVSGRSGNRGECAQFCRHRYTLRDGDGEVIVADKYLLSIKDLNLSKHLGDLVEAGISSFKIEGRLKESGYVKNVTAYYRQALDKILDEKPGLARSSSGRCHYSFTPDPSRSFNRGACNYFLTGKRPRIGSVDSPKSLGEKIGTVVSRSDTSFTLKTDTALHNGDGLCYFDDRDEMVGLLANRVEQNVVHHRAKRSPAVGTTIFRNLDVLFSKLLQQSDLCRSISLSLQIRDTVKGYQVRVVDEDGCISETVVDIEKAVAKRPGGLATRFEKQFRKSGGTVYDITNVDVQIDETVHVAAAAINGLRREALLSHTEVRMAGYCRQESALVPNGVNWISDRVTFLDNITNAKAQAFYRRHGVTEFDLSEESCREGKDGALMRTRYCIRAQLGRCKKSGEAEGELAEPFTLTDNTGVYILDFNCEACEMVVRKSK